MVEQIPLAQLVTTMRNGTTTNQNEVGRGVPVTRIETISTGTINPHKVRYADISSDDIERWRLLPGDILVSHINSVDHIGKSALYCGQPEVLIHGMNLLLMRPDQTRVLPEFLHYALRSETIRANIRARCKRAINQASINQKELGSIEVRVPGLDDQRKAIELLSRAENILRMRRDAEQKAMEIIPALFLDMFGDPATNPKGWITKRVDELTAVGTGGTPSRDRPDYYGGEFPWVKTAEIEELTITATEESITQKALEETNCKIFPAGTIVIAMYGQGQTRGRAGILGIEAATNQACAAVLPSNAIDGLFLYWVFRLQYERLRAMGRGGNQANLNLSMIKSFRVPVPDQPIQQAFATKAMSFDSISSSAVTAMGLAEQAFESLLAGVFGGNA